MVRLKHKVYEGSNSEGVKWVRVGNFTKNAVEEFEKELVVNKNKK